jgi:ribosomal protein S13
MYIFGVGRPLAQKILTKVGIAWNKKMGNSPKQNSTRFVTNLRVISLKVIFVEKSLEISSVLQKSVLTEDLATRSVFQFVVNEPRPMLVLVKVRRLQS